MRLALHLHSRETSELGAFVLCGYIQSCVQEVKNVPAARLTQIQQSWKHFAMEEVLGREGVAEGREREGHF